DARGGAAGLQTKYGSSFADEGLGRAGGSYRDENQKNVAQPVQDSRHGIFLRGARGCFNASSSIATRDCVQTISRGAGTPTRISDFGSNGGQGCARFAQRMGRRAP